MEVVFIVIFIMYTTTIVTNAYTIRAKEPVISKTGTGIVPKRRTIQNIHQSFLNHELVQVSPILRHVIRTRERRSSRGRSRESYHLNQGKKNRNKGGLRRWAKKGRKSGGRNDRFRMGKRMRIGAQDPSDLSLVGSGPKRIVIYSAIGLICLFF